jgi:uncharacterized 2Fe-2S/4Fe-4S cluster protein (DUF4445 family)
MTEFTVRFLPQDKSIRVPRGSDILSTAIKCGIGLSASCGGEGLCGKCRVIVAKGNVRRDTSRLISAAERRQGFVLACQTLIEDDLEVTVPPQTLESHPSFSHETEEFTKGIALKREGKFRHSSLVRKFYLKLPKPSQDDATSDLERVCREIGSKTDNINVSARLANVKYLGDILRENDFEVTAVVGHMDDHLEILAVEPRDTAKSNFGFAFDIGTTTVTGQLLDLNTKEILGSRIAFNRQSPYGSDVITRIIYASEPAGLEKLNEAVLENINEMITDLTSAYNVSLSDVYAICFAGNMTMLHLLLKIDPSHIRKAPYVPATTVFPTIHPSEIALDANPKGITSFLPGVSTYIGGDIVAGILACGLAEEDGPALLVDIGTNGEIVLGNRDWMIGSAASAGPAFEGSGLNSGMKAVKGAVNKVDIDDGLNVRLETIGAGPPKGICGSGYIDLLCQMLKRRVIEKDGKINRNIRSNRVRKAEFGYEFVVAFARDTDIGRDIVIRQEDIENLKRSKGAIYSAIMALLNKVDKRITDIRRIYIAGGFGNYLNIANSVFIGLLPDIDLGIYEFVGNSSLAGARMSLLSHEAFAKAHQIYKNVTYLDLSSEPNYMDEYIASLFFPHTDLGRFPSVTLS